MASFYISYLLKYMINRFKKTKFTLGDCWFGDGKLTRNADLNKYGYKGYDNAFDISL